MFLSCFLATVKVKLKRMPQLYRGKQQIKENKIKYQKTPQMWERSPLSGLRVDRYQGFDVVFESPVSMQWFSISCLWQEIWVVLISGDGGGRAGEKTKEHLQRSADILEVKKKQVVRTLSLNDGAWNKTEKCLVSLEKLPVIFVDTSVLYYFFFID